MYAKLNICLDFYLQVILEVLNEIGHTNISTVDSPAQLASQTIQQSKYGFSHPGSIAELVSIV